MAGIMTKTKPAARRATRESNALIRRVAALDWLGISSELDAHGTQGTSCVNFRHAARSWKGRGGLIGGRKGKNDCGTSPGG
jgi:hypothetical protein